MYKLLHNTESECKQVLKILKNEFDVGLMHEKGQGSVDKNKV
jgi:hypothetical protein